jgi:hypothetical protein
VPADGTSTRSITAYVTDGSGGSAVDDDAVNFTATPSTSGLTCGTFTSGAVSTDSSGIATTTYTAPTYSSGSTAPYCTITAKDADYGQTGTAIID